MMRKLQYRYISICIMTMLSFALHAQDPGMKALTLQDLSDFKQQSGNWQIVGDVTIDPTIDIHHQVEKPMENSKKKKKSKEAEAPKQNAVTFQSGKGILLNITDGTKKDNLVTAWGHGDIELEFEVMLPKGSNSGIFLQGRYEIQLLDSWGVEDPKFSDIGGIYRNWETAQDKIYMGKAPLSNAAKAPGLWQKMKIAFRAPRFDATGEKVANAKFTSVELNGVKIHDNVEVPLLTGGAIENNEKPIGPLMIQGDHGPVAFRNIKYKLMKEVSVSLTDITYKAYYGAFKKVDDFINAKPAEAGSIPELTCEVTNTNNAYALSFSGNLNVPIDATYNFLLLYNGGAQLIVNGTKVIDDRKEIGSLALKAGSYPIVIHNFKNISWIPPRLAFHVSTPESYPQALHAYNSFPPSENPVASIFINPANKTKLLRAFLDFKGDRSKRLTHTIGVGDPSHIHYIYDLNAGNIVCVWRGDFIDATPMWNDRGDGSFRPRGAVQYLFSGQPLAFLPNQQGAFSTTHVEDFKSKGYEIEENTGRPIFNYIYKNLIISDRIYPEDDNHIITHEVVIKTEPGKNTPENLFYKLAEGSDIVLMRNGSYAIDDKQYYIKVMPEFKPVIRESNGRKELMIPFTANSFKYSIIW